jgi:hypothetical protein
LNTSSFAISSKRFPQMEFPLQIQGNCITISEIGKRVTDEYSSLWKLLSGTDIQTCKFYRDNFIRELQEAFCAITLQDSHSEISNHELNEGRSWLLNCCWASPARDSWFRVLRDSWLYFTVFTALGAFSLCHWRTQLSSRVPFYGCHRLITSFTIASHGVLNQLHPVCSFTPHV